MGAGIENSQTRVKVDIIRPSLVPQLWVHKYGFVNFLEILPSTQGRGAVLDKTGGMTPPSHLTAAVAACGEMYRGMYSGTSFPSSTHVPSVDQTGGASTLGV